MAACTDNSKIPGVPGPLIKAKIMTPPPYSNPAIAPPMVNRFFMAVCPETNSATRAARRFERNRGVIRRSLHGLRRFKMTVVLDALFMSPGNVVDDTIT